MINWFKKKETPTYTYEIDVHKRIEALENTVKDLKTENEKLYRIMKYSSSIEDLMTHRLVSAQKIDGGYYGMYPLHVIKHELYIYHNKEEYHIHLPELDGENVYEDHTLELCKSMGDDYVCFKVTSKHNRYDVAHKLHTFIINYKTGQYIHNVEYKSVMMFHGNYDDCK